MEYNPGRTFEGAVTAAPHHSDRRLIQVSVGRTGYSMQRQNARALGELLLALADQADAAAASMPTAIENARAALGSSRAPGDAAEVLRDGPKDA